MTKYFPGYRYSPSGECELFEREEDVPDGWHRNTPEGLAKLEDGEPEADLEAMDRQELEDLATFKGIDLESVKGTGKNGNVLVGDLRKAIENA